MTEEQQNKIIGLLEQILKSGGELVEVLATMKPEQQQQYAPKVEAMIEKSKELIAKK